jgi:hypothetical protein
VSIAAVVSLGAMLAWCASVALQSDFSQVVRAGTDDAYYYFTAARNLANGHGLTVDGIRPTNGFHPLWLLLLVPVYLAHCSLDTSIRVITLLQGALLAVGAIILGRIHWAMFSPRTALASMLLLLLFVVPSSLAGMESSLLLTLLILLYGAALELYRHPNRGRIALWVGVLLGLTLLTRLDLVFLPVALALATMAKLRDPRARSHVRLAGLRVAAACAIVVVPYLLFNVMKFGAVMPISGAVKSTFPAMTASHGPFGALSVKDCAAVVLAVGVLVCRLIRWRASVPPTAPAAERYHRTAITVLAVSLLLHLSYTALFMKWGVFFWYYAFYPLFAVLLLAGWIQAGVQSTLLRNRPGLYWLALVGLAVFGITRHVHQTRAGHSEWQLATYDAARFVRAHTDPGAVFGMTDSGIFSYFSCRRVINLDGIVNTMEFQRQIAAHQVNAYLRDNHVNYLVQHAVLGHDEVVRGDYESMPITIVSHRFDVVGDPVLVYHQDELYRSPPYSHGAGDTVLVIWRYALAPAPVGSSAQDLCQRH